MDNLNSRLLTRRELIKAALVTTLATAGAYTLSSLLPKEAYAQNKKSKQIGVIKVDYLSQIADEDIDKYIEDILKIYPDLINYFGSKNIKHRGLIYIDIDTIYDFPQINWAQKKIGMPLHIFVGGKTNTVHELTHILTESGSNYIPEGLAVYVQNLFSNKTGWEPINSGDLHLVVFNYKGNRFPLIILDSLENLLDITKIRPEDKNSVDIAYNQSGSFVKFLIEDKGNIGNFMDFLNVSRIPPYPIERFRFDYKKHYGKDLIGLEQEWLNMLNQRYAQKSQLPEQQQPVVYVPTEQEVAVFGDARADEKTAKQLVRQLYSA